MQINQVLWVINSENQSVIPVKVVEKVTKETASGTKTELIVSTVTGKKINLSHLNSPYFEKSSDAYNHLMSAANKIIKTVIAKAEELAKQLGSVEIPEEHQVQIAETDDTIVKEEPEFITLPDGRQARVRIKLPEA